MEITLFQNDWHMETIRCPCCRQRLMDVRAQRKHRPRVEVSYKKCCYDTELFCHRCGTFIGVDR